MRKGLLHDLEAAKETDARFPAARSPRYSEVRLSCSQAPKGLFHDLEAARETDAQFPAASRS